MKHQRWVDPEWKHAKGLYKKIIKLDTEPASKLLEQERPSWRVVAKLAQVYQEQRSEKGVKLAKKGSAVQKQRAAEKRCKWTAQALEMYRKDPQVKKEAVLLCIRDKKLDIQIGQKGEEKKRRGDFVRYGDATILRVVAKALVQAKKDAKKSK